jgi:hypothetical protein
MRYALIGAIAEWAEPADAANADWAAMIASTDTISAQALCRRLMRVFVRLPAFALGFTFRRLRISGQAVEAPRPEEPMPLKPILQAFIEPIHHPDECIYRLVGMCQAQSKQAHPIGERDRHLAKFADICADMT